MSTDDPIAPLVPEIAKSIRERVLEAISRRSGEKKHLITIPQRLQLLDDVPLYAKILGTVELAAMQQQLANRRLFDPSSIGISIVHGVADAEGNPVFTQEDLDFLASNEANGGKCLDISRVVYHVNGFFESPDLVKELAKNSEGTEN